MWPHANSSPIPVTVVTGFLGAGKTTLVNRWLGDFARGDVAVVVNEHGDIGIDGELLAGRATELVEITGGCVCCVTQAELVHALEALAAKAPKRIVVETSGAASPAGVLRAIAGGGRMGTFSLDGVVTAVDATRVRELAGSHDLALEQIGYADVIVLTRSDACAADGMARVRDFVSACNGAAVVVDAPGVAALLDVLAMRRGDFVMRADVLAASHVYESVSLAIDGDVDGEQFADFVESELARVAGRIFRTKGIIAVAGVDERMIVQGVADLVEVTFGAPWGASPRSCRLVVVGYGLDRDELEARFAALSTSRVSR